MRRTSQTPHTLSHLLYDAGAQVAHRPHEAHEVGRGQQLRNHDARQVPLRLGRVRKAEERGAENEEIK